MRLEPGFFIAAATALIFYFRLIRVQKNRMRQSSYQKPESLIRRWPAAFAGIILALAGAYMAAPGYFPEAARGYWWIPITLGFLMFQFAV